MKHYRADIDGLRAIAVLSVVLFHFEPNWLSGGFTGVDIFFVISGYLISTIIFSSSPEKPFSYKHFYFNRAKRILPALLLAVFATTAIGLLVLQKDELAQLGQHLIAMASFNSNFQLLREAGYFDAKSEMKPLLHLWSLAVEEQFYFIWPTLFLFLYRRTRHSFLLLLACIALSLGWSLHITQIGDQARDFYSPLTRFWEIWCGALLAYLNLFKPRSIQWMKGSNKNIISFLGIALCIFSFFYLSKVHFFPGYWVILPVIGTVFVIAAGESACLNQKILSHPWVVFVGLISYPLYLWHWPLLSYSQIISNGTASLGVRASCIILAFLLAWFTYQFVEKKIRFNKYQEAITVTSLLGLLLIVLFLGLALNQNKIKGRLDGAAFDKVIESKYNYDEIKYDHSVTVKEPDGSVMLKGQTEKTVLLLGDSHMAMYWPRFDVLYAQNPPLLTTHYHDKSARLQGLIEWAKVGATDPKVVKVVLSYYWESGIFYSNSSPGEVNQEFKKVLELLIAAKKKVAMISSVPSGEIYSPNYMVDRIRGEVLSELEAPKRSVADFRAGYQARLQPLLDIAKSLGVEVIDPVNYLCRPDGQCPTTIDGDSIYFDSHHIRPKYVRQMKWLDRIVLE